MANQNELVRLRRAASGPRTMEQLVHAIETEISAVGRTLAVIGKKFDQTPKSAVEVLIKHQGDMRQAHVRRLTLIGVWEMATGRVWKPLAHQ